MKYSIIMLCYNQLHLTVKCIQSIFASTEDFELIIVDNGSDDETPSYLRGLADRNPNIKLIRNEKNKTFAQANNQGIPLATGELVCFLNNDTVVNAGWLDRLSEHLKNIPLTNLAMVGPVSSCSNGRQMVGIQDPEAWYQQNRGRWSHVGKLFGWCILIKKAVLDEIGGFDERFVNAYEDNDLCLRLSLAGYKMAIAYDTYIYHAGQGTLSLTLTKKQYIKSGNENREIYFNKWADERTKKLVAVYRLGNCEDYIAESLEQTSKFADSIIVHLCRSTDRTEKICERFPKVVKIGKYDGIFQEDYERNWLLQEALKMHKAGEADWCISIDGDEVYEDKFIGRVQRMMNPRNPEIMGYWCQWRTIWERRGAEELWRADSIFGRFSNYRMFKLIKGQEIHSRHPEGHHCGSAPLMGEDNLKWTNIRVKHLGYDTPEQRQKKFEFYQTNDHFKTRADIGNDDYSHLVDLNVQLEKWVPNNGISVIMMVKNEQDAILTCLEGIEPIADEFVIVDTGSEDRTVEIIEEFAKNSVVPVKLLYLPWCDNYSIPRNLVKYHATQRWILMIDADERFEYYDLRKIELMTETEADAAIFHVINYMKPTAAGEKPIYASSESVRLYRNIPEFYYSGIIHETIDDSLAALKLRRNINVGRSPVILHHYGYLRQKDRVAQKFDYYVQLNNRQIEVTYGKDPRPYFNLAMHWLQEDKSEDALKCFQKALEINPNFWHANQQMAALNIKSAKIFLARTMEGMPETHPFREEATKILEYLDQHTFGHAKKEV